MLNNIVSTENPKINGEQVVNFLQRLEEEI